MSVKVDPEFPLRSEDPERYGRPPSPTRENPGQFFPQSDPNAGTSSYKSGGFITGNPFVARDAIIKLEHSLSEVIRILEGDERYTGDAPVENPLLRKFKGWREELDGIRQNSLLEKSKAQLSTEGLYTD